MSNLAGQRTLAGLLLVLVLTVACAFPPTQLPSTAESGPGSEATVPPGSGAPTLGPPGSGAPTLGPPDSGVPTLGPSDSGVPTLDPTLASFQLAVYPPEARTGIEALDTIVDAVLAHDAPALRGLTRFLEVACTSADGLGGPPKCGAGEAEGTTVKVVPFLGPEGHHMRQDQFEAWPGPDVRGLLAAYSVSSQAYSDPSYPAGEYAVAFLDADGVTTLTLQVSEGRVVRFDSVFGESLEHVLARDADEMILPLASNPIPTSVPWPRFDDPKGRFAFDYPPTMTISSGSEDSIWRIGDQIEVFVALPGESWVACFDQALGDCPVVGEDTMVVIHDVQVRRVKGWIGSIGGRTPQEFLAYVFDLGGDQLVFTLYALPFDTVLTDITKVWPLEGMELELFERTVATVVLFD